MNIEAIAHIRTEFPEKFGIPRQSGLAQDVEGYIVFEPWYRNPDALRGLEDFDYIWLIWEFSANRRHKAPAAESLASWSPEGSPAVDLNAGLSPKASPAVSESVCHASWQPLVRPPRLGGNRTMGVFATRSPFRPNALGLSSVRVVKVMADTPEGPVIVVKGADLMDGTPIYDIKPYIRYADCHEDAACGYVDGLGERRLEVHVPDCEKKKISDARMRSLIQVLSLDPRPSYQDDPERVYGLSFAGMNVRFTVAGELLTVVSIEPRGKSNF